MILIAGDVNVDTIVQQPVGPTFRRTPGGCGLTQALAAAQVGAPVRLVGCRGNDSDGEWLQETLEQNEIDTRWLKVRMRARTGQSLITIGEDGLPKHLWWPGANGQLKPRALEDDDLFDDVSLVLLQSDMPSEVLQFLSHESLERQIPVLVTPSTRRSDMIFPISEADGMYLPSNLAQSLCDQPVQTVAQAREAGELLIDQFELTFVVIDVLGCGHLLVLDESDHYLPHASDSGLIYDRTGAGEAFSGVLAAAWHEGRPLNQAFALAHLASVIASRDFGPARRIPPLEKLEQFARAHSEAVAVI